MKCLYCRKKAGFFRKLCEECRKLAEAMRSLPPSFGYGELLDTLLATGVGASKIESFLDRDLDGHGSLNDQITARMTNQVMGSLGQPSQMKSADVKRVRNDIAEGRAPSQVDQEVIDYKQLRHKGGA